MSTITPFINDLVNKNKSLWDSAVNHQFMDDVCNDKLGTEKFRNFLIQMRFVSQEGLRGLLCRLLADTNEPEMVHQLTQHIQALQFDGQHFSTVVENLKSMGVDDPFKEEKIPATEAFCDYLLKIGTIGSKHEKLLAVTIFLEFSNARFDIARKKGKKPTNEFTSKWFNQHTSQKMNPWLTYLRSALEKEVKQNKGHIETSNEMIFTRILQWAVLVTDSAINRGMFEFPGTRHYHKGEMMSRPTGA